MKIWHDVYFTVKKNKLKKAQHGNQRNGASLFVFNKGNVDWKFSRVKYKVAEL